MRNVISTLLRRHLVASEDHLSSCSMAVDKIEKKILFVNKKNGMKILRQGTQHAQFWFVVQSLLKGNKYVCCSRTQTQSSDIMSSAPSTEPHLS